MTRLSVISEKSCSNGNSSRVDIPNEKPSLLASEKFVGNAALVTLGCAKNLVDSEIMLGSLKQKGYRIVTDPSQAEVVVVNTCAFLESAVKEGIDVILNLSKYKSAGRCRRLIVAGCMVERYRADLQKSLPEVDRFISTDELLTVGEEGSTTADCINDARRPYFLYDETMPRVISTEGSSAYLKIAEGCDRPCSFCIIPKIRGKFRSRPISSIVAEAHDLVREGVRELNLVAQDLTAYGVDLPGAERNRSMLLPLLRELEFLYSEERQLWLRLLYAYPIGVTEELVKHIIQSNILCNYLDLPLQHISNAVLKRMNRPLGEKGTRRLIEEMRRVAPELAIRTTFIVGFPGETDEDVSRLEDFIGEGHFTHVGVFTYSQEREAESYRLSEQLGAEEKDERRARLMQIQERIVEKRNNSLIGKKLPLIIEGAHSDTDLLLCGRTEWQAPEVDGNVIINNFSGELREAIDSNDSFTKTLCGRFGVVEITESAGYDLVGTLISID